MGSLSTALGGLQANQSWLDVIGNNIANANTPGFKSSRALFSDLFSQSLSNATSPTGLTGGRNPSQVGLGVRVGHVDKNLAQGTLNFTGRTFDLALVGGGYFVVADDSQQHYTRVGTFGIDANNELVDLRTGYHVLSDSAQPITIDTSVVVPSAQTENIAFSGNLSAKVTGPLAEVVSTSGSIQEGTAASLTGSVAGPFAIPSGQTFTMTVKVGQGASETVSVTSTTGTVTAADVANAINAVVDGATATVEPTGEVTITTDQAGASQTIKVTPGQAGFDLAGTLGLSTSLVSGTEFAAQSTSDLNDLVANESDYAVGDTIEVSGNMADGTPVAGTFTYGVDGTTIGDLVSFLNTLYADSTFEFDADEGKIVGTANETGESLISLVLEDGSSQAGGTQWATHAVAIDVPGTGPDTAMTSSEIFDAAGTAHVLTYTYERQDDGSWTMTVSSDDPQTEITNGVISGITFGPNGALNAPAQAAFEVQFQNQPSQTVNVDLGSVGQFDGVTQFGGKDTVVLVEIDGYSDGELASIGVNADGSIDGIYSNGQIIGLGQLGIASFDNPGGLRDSGDGYYGTTGNSGSPVISKGLIAGAGEVVGSALEQSNVDTAEQFVRLIEAQRGFQANARVISTLNDLFAEIVNII